MPALQLHRLSWLLGVYKRYGSSGSDSEQVLILRYRCKTTKATVSLLPDFVQPYLLVATDLIEDLFFGRSNRYLANWQDLLVSYHKRFESWYQQLSAEVGFALGRAPPEPSATAVDYFQWLVGACGNSLREVTRTLTKQLKVSTFGRYKCHLNYHEKRRASQEASNGN